MNHLTKNYCHMGYSTAICTLDCVSNRADWNNLEISGSLSVPYGQVVYLKCDSSNITGSNMACFGGSTYSPITTANCPRKYGLDRLLSL